MIDEAMLKEAIERIAPTISPGPLGLALHRAEYWTRANRSFENVAEKTHQDGGASVFGWTFAHRLAEGIPGPGYLLVTHHAVWHATDGRLVDVTPYPQAALRPISPGGDTLFLVDQGAAPVRSGKQFTPLASRFFPLSGDPALAAHIAALEQREKEAMAERVLRGRA